jgi:hypothetical protein
MLASGRGMFEHYVVSIWFRAGHMNDGHGAVFDPVRGVVRFGPGPGAPPTAEARLADVGALRLTLAAGSDARLGSLPLGAELAAVFPGGQEIVGHEVPIPVGGGRWLKMPVATPTFVFVPDGAASRFETRSAAPAPSYEEPELPRASRPPVADSAPERSVNVDPYEAATIGEFDAIDPSKLIP